MERGLAVLLSESDAEKELLQQAATFSDCSDAPLTVLAVVSPSEYDSVAETMDLIGEIEHTSYDDDAIFEGLRKNTRDIVEDAIGDMDVPYEIAVQVEDESDRADVVLTAAREHDCDHVFLVGQRRSPTGKALFGDLTQKIILNFEGDITLSME
ncbi:universal stress protein [Halorhabdus sp. CUG00001]|uniref:universal stress protein n=1 Tax=Halorhabdus sp. CUG00001 TaxID=2600297 RepID=UPI00131C47F0|nr:universal stress protein [Halorhabdus sp. CUG00001]